MHIAATPGAHFGQPPAPYGAPNMANMANMPNMPNMSNMSNMSSMSPYGQLPQSAGGFGRGGQPPHAYMGAPQQHGGYGGAGYGGYQG